MNETARFYSIASALEERIYFNSDLKGYSHRINKSTNQTGLQTDQGVQGLLGSVAQTSALSCILTDIVLKILGRWQRGPTFVYLLVKRRRSS